LGRKSRVLVVGFDAADKDLISEWSADGSLPNFRELAERSAWGDVKNPASLEAGSAWPSFYYGSPPAVHGQYDGIRLFDSQSYAYRKYENEELAEEPIWTRLSRENLRCILIDPPYIPFTEPFNGLAVLDWATHAPHNGADKLHLVVEPPSFQRELLENYGPDPLGGHTCDYYRPRSLKEQIRFRDALIKRVDIKTRLALDLIERPDWDFFLSVFGECHCIGHHSWHCHDAAHPEHNPNIAEALGDPVKDVYIAIDAALGKIMDQIGDDDTCLVYISHGMGPGYSGTRLLDRILSKLEGMDAAKIDDLKRRALIAWRGAPKPIKKLLGPLHSVYYKRAHNKGFLPGRENRKFFEVIANDRSGGVRINLAGREARGVVQPGVEYDAICNQLVEDLSAVTNAETNEPLAASVLKTRDVHQGDQADRLPDITVTWNRSAPIRIVQSPKIGRIAHPGVNARTGDHTPFGRFFAVGPTVRPGRLNAPAHAWDFAPTLAQLLNAPLEGATGRPIEALTDGEGSALRAR